MPIIIGLDARTRLAMDEAFAGKTCVSCNEPARRMLGFRFYCHDCTRGSKFGKPEATPVHVHTSRYSEAPEARRRYRA